jgi:hypothetical protein
MGEPMDDAVQLTVEIKNRSPVEVADFARSMLSLGQEYQRFLAAGEHAATPEDVKLYVREIRSGSIIATLAAAAPVAIPFIEHSQSIIEFAKHLETLYGWLKGDSAAKPAVEKTTLHNLSSIVEPVAKDKGAQLNIGALNVQGDLVVSLNLSSLDANAVQNNIRRELDLLAEPIAGAHDQVVMYWAQARNAKGKAGDKARIESIYAGDVKVRFANDRLKSRMLHDQPYPFGASFVVDVAVETVGGRPVLYKVLRLHEIIKPEDQA